ncbi:DUF4238 domain-containing protein [Methanoregula sp. UBA64]|jgi:hypothetical protein|uniref:DUF4238 domain-containing protein n=1 Tax=Methanoregula sp. UBA64 TaxID=1915554 RepID=UPI0025DB4ECF|nr:DUF4238 domain-containing protein [Methanoregula sp. UBA64]
MTAYVNQHFIPRWYLRNFSPNYNKYQKDGDIFLYLLKKKKVITGTIKKTAMIKNFYGVDGIFESTFLKGLDEKTSIPIASIIKNEKIDESQLKKIGLFLRLQSIRTESSKRIMQNFLLRPSKKYPNELRILRRDKKKYGSVIFEYYIKLISKDSLLLSDLKLFLLKNTTKRPFISSDYPVVLNNYFYQDLGVYGLYTPGIQVICPLSDTLCLLLIHSELYDLLTSGDSVIELSKEQDIDSINCLQFINCDKFILSKQEIPEYFFYVHQKSGLIKDKLRDLCLKRRFEDTKDRVYSIPLSFLSAREGIDFSQFEKNSPKDNLPVRNRMLYDESNKSADKLILEFNDVISSYFKNEKHIVRNVQRNNF